ncbi:uncharacterized protein P174DRAFT_421455 [Aspergillus novofumigatus IBT 16806]|uniref:Uncharacterized protein n=1 Tax=Aspergillus novofumigatus (strain IBT 16806) TaxID=1392255 RepID=A0A2I1C447_ASPN1|nr:uncharacterized protein P174DRAFT_421455 [Aspergillus novofumigatus IBT 16806]PKX92385.1 hypothetical protein P174DRAFT_421455 [Aspergillus novofumigatus IBT 16806]
MDNPGTAEFLCSPEGMDITLDPPSEPPFYLSRQTWTSVRCHRKDNPSKKAFMRIYLQIPVIGTQYQSPQIRRKH